MPIAKMPKRASLPAPGPRGGSYETVEKRCPEPDDNRRCAPAAPQAKGKQAGQPRALNPSRLSKQVTEQKIGARPHDQCNVAIEYGNAQSDLSQQFFPRRERPRD